MMTNTRSALVLLVTSVVFLCMGTYSYAATLTLDPLSSSTPAGNQFQVQILIDTEGDSATSVDAILNYDSTILQVASIVNGGAGVDPFFPDFFQNIGTGEIYIGAAVLDPIDKKTGTGTVATITFEGIAEGVSDLTFDCTPGKTSDTNISKSDKNVTDIVDCTKLSKGQYSVGTGIAPTKAPVTPGPTNTPVPPGKGGPVATSTLTPTPTLQQISVTPGSTEVTLALVGIGVLLIIGSFGGSTVLKSLG